MSFAVFLFRIMSIIDGGSSDPEKLCNLLILLALMRQEQGSCTVDVSSFFVTPSDIRGQKNHVRLGLSER